MGIEISKLSQSALYKKIISNENIFYSIYAIDSYIFEKELLEQDDYNLLIRLKDKFDDKLINNTIKKVRKKLVSVILKDELFETMVYFRPKKVSESKSKYIDRSAVVSRPLHVADLHTQIAIASILNAILMVENNNNIELSELGRILPGNFYGNIPSGNPSFLFEPWQNKYKEYSKKVNESYSRYLETKEYCHEIMIDLENFFPSIQPAIVYEKILEILAVKYIGEELECLKIVILKLLYMKVCNNKINNYYCLKKDAHYYLNIKYTQGIPQGLPQSYLFGNICMINVAEKYEEIFKGQAYYYVDDSVIYTDIFYKKENISNVFAEVIKELNKSLDGLNIKEENIRNNWPKCGIVEDIEKLNKILEYKIQAHELGGKSEISEINSEKIGSQNLEILGKFASLSSFELSATFSDSEEDTLKSKYNELKKSIEAELIRIDKSKGTVEEAKNYKKYLIRYKKFMRFRERLLNFRSSDDISNLHINRLINKFVININAEKQLLYKDINLFFLEYSEDILLTEILFILKNNYNSNIYKKIVKMINKFDNSIYGDQSKNGYFSKIIKNMSVEANCFLKNFDKYSSVKGRMDCLFPDFSNKQTKVRKKAVAEIIESINKGNKEEFFIKIDNGFSDNGYFKWVNRGSDELFRQVLNVYMSKIYGIDITESVKINHIGRRPVLYNELRMLTFIRNKYFKLDDFIIFANVLKIENDNCTMDYTLVDIIEYYVSFVKTPKYVDDLIQIHKYTSEIWKNGSKFLHFYTLHNHEHAIELIKGIIKFIKNLDCFQISKTDYYILFISCYLHDISMVLHPDLIKDFTNQNDQKANIIMTDFREDFSELLGHKLYLIDSKQIKKMLVEYYKKIDQFFEENIRDKHAINSAEFIRETKDLGFIEKTIRDIIGEISEAHCYDILDIYDVKSNAKESLVSKKYLKILLRIGDLLDVADNRVSNAVFRNNDTYMSKTTIFHWLSHQAISGYDIKTFYSNKFFDENQKNESYISKGAIEEKIIIIFYLNVKHYVGIKKRNCNFCHSKLSQQYNVELKINENKGEACSVAECNFICRWMVEKNKYLFEELFSLQKYLKRSSNNLFETIFEVQFECNTDAKFLEAQEYNLINNYILK